MTIAVIDSGIATHYDSQNGLLSDRVLKRVNFVSGETSVDDTNGHGSHIAGIIAGNGAKSGGAYVGIAPNANLVDVRVTDDQGRGSMSDVVAGIQWVYNNRTAYNIRVANLSLNSTVVKPITPAPWTPLWKFFGLTALRWWSRPAITAPRPVAYFIHPPMIPLSSRWARRMIVARLRLPMI